MSAKKRAGQFHIRLQSRHRGRFTQWRACGSVPTTLPKQQLQHLMEMITYWSGWPVELVLPVEVDTAGWCELWADALADVPAEYLHLRLVVCRRRAQGKRDG